LAIKLEELNKRKYKTDGIIDSNLRVLCERLNKVRAAWGRPMIVTSGLRDAAQQADLIKAGKSKATKSMHLVGLAADIADPDGALGRWCLSNAKLLESIGLWMEHPDHTPGWVHMQASPPRSGNRFFIP
jgi:uncharacterized protein YcbK (DUF882 family)